MNAEQLFKQYILIKKERDKKDIPIEVNTAYLSGWLDCANYIIDSELKEREQND